MKNKQLISYGCNGVSAIATAMQTNELLQNAQIVITCVAFCVSIAFTIYHWYKEATKDGKIDKDEVKDLIDDASKQVEEFKENIKGEDNK